MSHNRLYETSDYRATLDYCERGAYYDIEQPSIADLFDDYCARFPKIEALDFINDHIASARDLDQAEREIKRRLTRAGSAVQGDRWTKAAIEEVAIEIARLRRLLRDLGASEFWRNLDLENTLV